VFSLTVLVLKFSFFFYSTEYRMFIVSAVLGTVRKIAKSDYQLHRVFLSLSVCPHGTTRLPLEGFS